MIRPVISKFLNDLTRVAKTTAFRYSLLFTIAFSILTGISMVMIYQTAAQEIAEQVDARLYTESSRLKREIEYRHNVEFGQPSVGVTERVATEPAMSYCVARLDKLDADLIPQDKNRFVMLNSNFSDLCDFHRESVRKNADIMRIIITPVVDDYALILSYDTRSQRRLLVSMLNIVYLVTGLLLIVSFIGSFLIARNIINSIARISHTARLIVDGDFSERIRTSSNDSDELNQLAGNLNHMLDRIENLITSQRQVTNNIAHDLRSPLNRLRNRMEVALMDKNVSCDELRDVIGQSVDDAENLLKTFNALLNIAQVESRARDDFAETDVSQICTDLAELYEVMSEEGEHSFSSDIAHGLSVMGNRQLLAQAIINLLDNAVKYTPEGGHITLNAARNDKQIVISVSDNGMGIPDGKREEVLKRFVRLDSARSTPGNGLGLSLVSAVIALHGGTINLLDNQPGLRIELWLPTIERYTRRHKKSSVLASKNGKKKT
ncbi:ATP-binding protein [Suttonella sp. R2A3]|uniref:sensor histidine kinase n=1 Tax=Suttonella sp. R2A3 TaxID=2908648 RepID=UPI001F2FE338|nr:ATP-binding protein [Suttonella sp. R2A3]UJF24440.1 ATP-binding protein [Suttonella sp. R2A3]